VNFCQTCGTALQAEAAFCASCGAGRTGGAAAIAATPAASGMTSNTAGALAYLLGFLTGIVFLVLDPYKNDRFVRFHAFQSIFFNLAWIGFWIAWTIVGIVLSAITKGLFFFLQLPIDLILMLGGAALWVYLMYSAYQNKTVKLPVIGALAAKQAGI
jgi:uncharacterized membrane protein